VEWQVPNPAIYGADGFVAAGGYLYETVDESQIDVLSEANGALVATWNADHAGGRRARRR
jgi:hypothetical protein